MRRPRGGASSSAGPGPLPPSPLLLLVLLACGPGRSKEAEAGAVTCGSVLKLLNTRHNVRLHSHEVKYGSGSGQQSVTGVEGSDDANSYWRIRGKIDGSCQRGVPVKCGQAVRLTHVNTGKNLHTHHFPSPLSNNQIYSSGPKIFGAPGTGSVEVLPWTGGSVISHTACILRRGLCLFASPSASWGPQYTA